MTLSFAQRVGLAPAELTSAGRRMLLAARAAAICFLALGALVLAAAAAGGDLGTPALVATIACLALAGLLVAAYERLPRWVNRLIALTGTLIVAELTFFQPAGPAYASLYLGVIIYVTFFFSRSQALLQLLVVMALWGLALAHAHAPGDAAQLWILGAGTAAGTAAVTRAIHDRLARAAERAKRHRAALDAFFLHAPGGFAFLDDGLRHVRVNDALAELSGRPRAEIEGRTIREISPTHADVLEPVARRILRTGRPAVGIELPGADGRHFLVSYFPVPGASGALGVGAAVMDITHLKHVERRLEETNQRLTVLATTDELTGLPNRRMLAEQLDLALARARRGGLGVAVLCLDLDRFKEINDSLGHAVGDDLLVEVACRLRAGARETDVVARYGGDEFVILLADLDVQAAPELAATVVGRLRSLLAEPFAIGPVELQVEASIGVALYPFDSRDAKGLLAAADAEMYSGKTPVSRVA